MAKVYMYMNNLSKPELVSEVERIESILELVKSKLSNQLIDLSSKVGQWEMKRLEKAIKEQAQETKQIADSQEMLKDAKETLEEVEKKEEATKPEYKQIKEFIETWKNEEIEWFLRKYESGDREDCSKQDIKMLEQGMDYIVKVLDQDAQIRLATLIAQIKDRAGEVVDCKLTRNGNNGYDGWIKGTRESFAIQTILAGGYNIQRLHYRTIFR